MSRHKYIRNMDYDEEYDDAFDDTVYGRSLDDEYSIVSPSSKQYMYNYAHGIDDGNEDLAEEYCSRDDLSATDKVRLDSILDHITDILGSTSISIEDMTDVVIRNDFDSDKSVNSLLNRQTKKAVATPAASGSAKKSKKNKNKAAANKSTLPSKKGPAFSSPATKTAPPVVVTPSTKVVVGFNVEAPPKAGGRDTPTRDGSPEGCRSAVASPLPPRATPKAKLPTRQRDKPVDALALFAEAHPQGARELLNLVVVGHVDAGKSTLTGHLLWKQGNVNKRLMHKYDQESKKTGKQTAFAWVMDETQEERERGVTVDVAERCFETERRTVNILDAPGHRDFVPNMISGAARADVAMLVIDASTGEFEAGFETSGQTKEHALLIKSLGVPELIVAVNKLDTVGWAQERYKEISERLGQFLKSLGYRPTDVTYVPCSGLSGENLTAPPKEAQLSQWFQGPTIIQAIDGLKPPTREVSLPTRYCVHDVFKGMGGNMCVSGKLIGGMVKAGDKLLLQPNTLSATVKDVSVGGASVGQAFAGDSAILTLSGLEPEELHVGAFLTDPALPMPHVARMRARVVLFNITVPLIKGSMVDFHYQSSCEQASVAFLESQINKSTGEVVRHKPRVLVRQSAGVIELQLQRPLCVECYQDNKELGRFMLRQQGKTVAAGHILEVLESVSVVPSQTSRGLS